MRGIAASVSEGFCTLIHGWEGDPDSLRSGILQGIVLLYACVGIIGLILGDLLMVLIDPRISFGKKEGGR